MDHYELTVPIPFDAIPTLLAAIAQRSGVPVPAEPEAQVALVLDWIYDGFAEVYVNHAGAAAAEPARQAAAAQVAAWRGAAGD